MTRLYATHSRTLGVKTSCVRTRVDCIVSLVSLTGREREARTRGFVPGHREVVRCNREAYQLLALRSFRYCGGAQKLSERSHRDKCAVCQRVCCSNQIPQDVMRETVRGGMVVRLYLS